ncbi:MAG TPA: hypothetical protein VFC00_30790 [Micromonosporaceae bacterium]|nr:hypothetical protein [Micromonosporaceae bacterium]
MTLTEAKDQIRHLLGIAEGDADAVYRSIRASERNCRQYDNFTEADEDEYCMLRLALSDITGNAFYRG